MGTKIQKAYGVGAPLIDVFPVPINAQVAPVNGVNTNYPQGQQWFVGEGASAIEYIYQGAGTWATGTPGSISSVVGTANQVTSSTAGSVVTLSIPSTFIAPGSVAATSTVAAGTSVTASNGNLIASTLGTGILLNSSQASGAAASPVVVNGRSGRATFTSVSIAAAADLTLTLTNSSITASTTEVMISMSGATTGSALSIKSKTASSGSLAIVVTNGTGATTTTADIQIDFLVLNA
jgi:hypothetical protein